MTFIKIYSDGGLNPDQAKNIATDRNSIINELKVKYKTSFSCENLSQSQLQQKLANRTNQGVLIISTCKSKSKSPKIKVTVGSACFIFQSSLMGIALPL